MSRRRSRDGALGEGCGYPRGVPDPLVDEPPEVDPFVDLLFDERVGGAVFVVIFSVLIVIVVLRKRRQRAADADFGDEEA